MAQQVEIQPADARVFGAAVRKEVKRLGIPGKVVCRAVSFSGLGYGSCPFAELDTPHKLTEAECASLAEVVRQVRALPAEEGGGKGIISLRGQYYAFGGAISHKDHLGKEGK